MVQRGRNARLRKDEAVAYCTNYVRRRACKHMLITWYKGKNEDMFMTKRKTGTNSRKTSIDHLLFQT
jgi:hypothetical protein